MSSSAWQPCALAWGKESQRSLSACSNVVGTLSMPFLHTECAVYKPGRRLFLPAPLILMGHISLGGPTMLRALLRTGLFVSLLLYSRAPLAADEMTSWLDKNLEGLIGTYR